MLLSTCSQLCISLASNSIITDVVYLLSVVYIFIGVTLAGIVWKGALNALKYSKVFEWENVCGFVIPVYWWFLSLYLGRSAIVCWKESIIRKYFQMCREVVISRTLPVTWPHSMTETGWHDMRHCDTVTGEGVAWHGTVWHDTGMTMPQDNFNSA